VPVEHRGVDGAARTSVVQLGDWNSPETNDWLVELTSSGSGHATMKSAVRRAESEFKTDADLDLLRDVRLHDT